GLRGLFASEPRLVGAAFRDSVDTSGQLSGERAHAGLDENVLVVSRNVIRLQLTVQQAAPSHRRVRHDVWRLLAGAEQRNSPARIGLDEVAHRQLDVTLADRLELVLK